MNSRNLATSAGRLLLAIAAGLAAAPEAQATPQFARQHDVPCSACHTIPPMLNSGGVAFQTRGYLPSETVRGDTTARDEALPPTIPIAAWITARYEDQGSDGASELHLPKVELISGGKIGKGWSYFVEWRIVSLGLRSDGSLNDRSGRFEDLFVDWQTGSGNHAVKVGQYRSLNQVDVSLRLSPSEPTLFNNGLRTGTDPDPRLNSLHTFSPAGRSPGLGYRFQSIRGKRAGDGLFHYVTVPFAGEFSIPLSREADQNASFELDQAKGLYVETFYRRGLKSIGAHAFSDGDGAWLGTALGTWNWRGLFLTAGAGVDDANGRDRRERGSFQAEYLVTGAERFRGAAGVRLEEVSDDGQRVGYVPYLVVSAPNTRYTLLLQLEYKDEEDSDTFVADLSLLF